jgi:hypothetical protein
MISTGVVKQLERNREKRLAGDVVAIPYPFKRLSEYLPGIEQAKYHIVTAAQKAGKTQIVDHIYVFNVIDWWIENRNRTNIKPKIFYFSLEVSRDLKILSAISYKLFKSYNIIISPQKLRSVFQNYILDEKILNIINSPEFQRWLKEFEDIITIVEDIRNPYGIYLTMKTYAEAHGKYEYENIPWQDDLGNTIEKRVIKEYIPDNKNEFVFAITDNLNLLQAEKGDTLHEAIKTFSNNYCLKLRDRFKYIIVNIMQQSADSQTSAFDFRGDLVVNRVKPTPFGLGDCKLPRNDCNLMMSLFYPYYYEIEEYNGIDLRKIGDNHRELSVLLNRDGMSNLSIDLLFFGAANHFRELPKVMGKEIYEKIDNLKSLEI